jgi:hypothetical protein
MAATSYERKLNGRLTGDGTANSKNKSRRFAEEVAFLCVLREPFATLAVKGFFVTRSDADS